VDMFIWTLVIFVARVVDVSLGTIRVHFIVRQKKLLATLAGFVEVMIVILIVSRVIQDIQHWPYVLAYAGGFATGTLLGMCLTEELSRQAVQTTVISNGRSREMRSSGLNRPSPHVPGTSGLAWMNCSATACVPRAA
jgi:uncharacterized protein YebE (UPF0316 family)